ncbi:MAG: hypothetical protein LBT55_05690 [Clostridiaceae bacterium]|jgi:hypothetical protein|nr:hypothetical protein [Clostridiaceae bacterium]
MKTSCKDGALIAQGKFYEDAPYDVGNKLLNVRFDGRGGVSRYAVIDKFESLEFLHLLMSFDGKPLNYAEEKRVTVSGRKMTIDFEVPGLDAQIVQFVPEEGNAVITRVKLSAKKGAEFGVVVNWSVDYRSYMEQFFLSRLSLKNLVKAASGLLKKHIRCKENVIRNDILGDVYVDFAGNFPIVPLEKNYFYQSQFSAAVPLKEGETKTLDLVISCGSRGDFSSEDAHRFLARADELEAKADAYAASLVRFKATAGNSDGEEINSGEAYAEASGVEEAVRDADGFTVTDTPENNRDGETQVLAASKNHCADGTILLKQPFKYGVSERDSAFYASCLNCALSNYKERGKFKGFLAGVNYQFPARTYFRDGYWTSLPVIAVKPEFVRNQIITLSGGIGKKGKCPSAVKSSFKAYWGDHFDSPSFFVLLIYDYVAHTGDVSVLFETRGKRNILALAAEVTERLIGETDSTGLLVKRGEFNRRDWCDNVFRTGYVTYDEALFARALKCLSELFGKCGDTARAARYYGEYERVKKALNDILWSEEKGYFVNYKNEKETEDNLSADTVTVALFGLASPERIESMLRKMESTLESRSNKEQVAGDFGVLSVYPFYKNTAVISKSSLPYYYHNGGDWPYLSAAYAYAKLTAGMDYGYPLTRWFDYNLARGNLTPVEFFSPCHKDGSPMQGWSAFGALLPQYPDGKFFEKPLP